MKELDHKNKYKLLIRESFDQLRVDGVLQGIWVGLIGLEAEKKLAASEHRELREAICH